MKNHKQELFGRMQRQYHRHHQWRLGQDSLFIPHSYKEKSPDSLSWWDDVGFILNGRRVIVWWVEPHDVAQVLVCASYRGNDLHEIGYRQADVPAPNEQ